MPTRIANAAAPMPEELDISNNPHQMVGYSDIASIRVTSEEIVFHFGLRGADNPNRGEGVAKIYVSLPHAKRIAIALTNILKNYEEVFGNIAVNAEEQLLPEVRDQLKKEIAKQEKGEQDGE